MLVALKQLILKYRHATYLLYYIVVVGQFQLLEIYNKGVDNWIWCSLDYQIPYIGAFVIPYILWFFYVGIAVALLCLFDKKEYYKLLTCIYIGMSICFVVYILYPHGQPLRVPLTGQENSFFDRMVANMIYANDTPTNSAPSIHVINSIFSTIALTRSKLCKNKPLILVFIHTLNLLIIASTVFIKQHSIIDVLLGFALAILMYVMVYTVDWQKMVALRREKSMQTA